MAEQAPDILLRIFDHKKQEVAAARSAVPRQELLQRIADLEDRPRGFVPALRAAEESGWIPVIAEVKKGSPSRGVIRADFDPIAIAESYEKSGASAISVLTDEQFFLGHLSYLALIREQVRLPLLRKDFIFDPYQVYEARAAGADAILLIAAMLDLPRLRDLADLARELSLDVLLEVHDERELETALQVNVELLGINNRSLRTFVTDIATTERLAKLVPGDRMIISESGITTRADILRLVGAGAHGFLIGESLMREEDPGAKLLELLSGE